MGIGLIVEGLKRIGMDVEAGYPIERDVFQWLIASMSALNTEEFRKVVKALESTKEGRSGYFYFVRGLNVWSRRSFEPNKSALRARA